MTIRQHKIRIQINDRYTSSDRVAIARSIITFIQERSNNGVGVKGEPSTDGLYSSNKEFPGYSQNYINSKKFKSKAKSPFSVNLKLDDKMLRSLKLLDHGTGYLEIGYEAGSRENAKAEGNIIGSYGRSPNPSKARNFLGITESELRSILLSFPLPDDPRLSAIGLLGIAFLIEDQSDVEEIPNFDIDLFEG